MIIQVPENQLYGSALVSGWVQSGTTESLHIAVILKTAYDLADNGNNPRLMIPTTAEERVAIVFADDGNEINLAGTQTFDVTYEADIALNKDHTDIVVRGYMPNGPNPVNGTVRINQSNWLTRNAVPLLHDTSRNLFGFQPRMEASRKIDVDPDFVPSDGNLLPPEYNRSFNNFHRSSSGFSFNTSAQLPSGGLVEIHQTANHSDTAYRFNLPNLDLVARYRFYDGNHSDKELCWQTTEINSMRPDTLIVEPDTHRATILWRGSWDANEQPFDAYRRVEITQGDI